MHNEERSWKLPLLAEIMVPNSSQWRMMSYRYFDRIQVNSELKEVRNSYKKSLWEWGRKGGKQKSSLVSKVIRFGMRDCNNRSGTVVITGDRQGGNYWMWENLSLHFHSRYKTPFISKTSHTWAMQQSPNWSHLQFLTPLFYPICHFHSSYFKALHMVLSPSPQTTT